MKKYIHSIKAIILILILAIAAGAFAGAPLLRIWQQKATIVKAEKSIGLGMADELALKKLMSVFGRMSEITSLYAVGEISAIDPSVPDNKMNTTFIYCRDNERLYYRVGNQEVISLPDIYIAVNHDIKKIFISQAKITLPPLQMSVDSLLHLWKGENYTLSETVSGKLTTVDMRCDNHITCKEYKAVYDVEKQFVTAVYMRLTNLDDPLNDKMDRQVAMSFNEWEERKAPPELFRLSQYVHREREIYLPASRLKDYELMTSF
jgi:hypothetical protein